MNNTLSIKVKIAIIAIVSCALFASWKYFDSQPKLLTRAAVDVGSGSIKVTLAKVDPTTHKIDAILYSKEHEVQFKRDLQVGGTQELSEKIQAVAMNTLSSVKSELTPYRPSEWKGIATAASRQAKNAEQMYGNIQNELGIDIEVISQNEEGRLGFLTAAAVSGIPVEQIVAVDSGSGSFQLTTLLDDRLEVIEGQLGHIPSVELLMDLRDETLDMNRMIEPVTLAEATALVEKMKAKMPQMPEPFAQKIKAPGTTIVGIGNENFIFAAGAKAVGKNEYTKEELWSAIELYAGKPASEMQQFAHPETAVLGMVLLYSIMDSMEVDQLHAHYANGSCEGLLVDSEYWVIA